MRVSGGHGGGYERGGQMVVGEVMMMMSPFLTLVEGVFFGVRFRRGCLVQWFLCWFS